MTETPSGPAFEWRWYEEYKQAVKRPSYIPDLPLGSTVALSQFTDRYDFMGQRGSESMGLWFDLAARNAGR